MTENTRKPVRTRGLLEIHAAVLLFGFSGLFAKFLDVSPIVIVLGRTGFASLILYIALCSTGKTPFAITGRRLGLYLLQGLLLAVHWSSFFHAIQISTVAIGLLTFSTFPLFTTALEPVFFKERLSAIDILSALTVFLGLVLVVPSVDLSRAPVQGALWGTFSGLTFALLAIVNRKNVMSDSPMSIAFYQNLFAGLILLPAALLTAMECPGLTDIALLACLGILCTAIAHSLFIKALASVNARTVSVITALEPVYGIIFALVLLGEIPGLRTLLGGILILGASGAAGYTHARRNLRKNP